MGVKLLLFHSRLAERTCTLCRAWLYDEAHRPIMRLGRRVSRPPASPTPCWQCPKQSPTVAAGFERDRAKIERTLESYFRVRATAGQCLAPLGGADRLLARHLALVDAIVRRHEQQQLVRSLIALRPQR